jgi:predicted lipoprotein with Yx(FWY)xxD motif
MRRYVLAAMIALPLVLAACSNPSSSTVPGGGSTSSAPTTANSTSSAPAAGTVNVAQNDLGMILTNADGRTLYLFEQDTGTTSSCTGGCATTWPALTASGTPTAGQGVNEALLDTNGDGQVTYAGHPLYIYSGDSAPGDTNGEGISGLWFAVSTAGDKVEASAGGGGPGY